MSDKLEKQEHERLFETMGIQAFQGRIKADNLSLTSEILLFSKLEPPKKFQLTLVLRK